VDISEILEHLETAYKGRPCIVIFCPVRKTFFVGQQEGHTLGPFELVWDGHTLSPDVSNNLVQRHTPKLPPICGSVESLR